MNHEDSKNRFAETEEERYDEPSPEDFMFTEEELKQIEARTKKRQAIFRVVGIFIAFLLIIQGGYHLFDLWSYDARQLARTSEQLSQEERIASLKEAVVTIQAERSKGTGFVIAPNGYILTNHHVVHKKGPLAVIFPDGTIYQAQIVAMNEALDIALLKVDGEHLPYLTVQNERLRERDKIYVIGNPLSQTQIVNEGEIVNEEEPFQVLKISNPIYPGHSGSPVLSETGDVIGVVYARTLPRFGEDESSYGLAVPMERVFEAIPIVSEIVRKR